MTPNARPAEVGVPGGFAVVAGSGTPGFGGDNGPATGAELSDPCCIAVDSAGNLNIADGGEDGGSRIRKVSNGVITTVAGTGTNGLSGDNGPATSAELSIPAGIAVDSDGNLYIADWGSDRIRKVSNGIITTVAGTGTNGFSGDTGPATSAQFHFFESPPPGMLAVDSAGNVYIADFQNQRIRLLTPDIAPSTHVVATHSQLSCSKVMRS